MNTKNTIATDREVQLMRERAYASGDEVLGDMLQQLLDFRRDARIAVAMHDPRNYCNMGLYEIGCIVEISGCEWWQCRERAHTIRMSRNNRKPTWLCRGHADEGTQQNLWQSDHPHNVRWVQEDIDDRARELRWAAERSAAP
jgi:hypothetical protein